MNPWDSLSDSFNTHKVEADIDPGAADNIFIAWPALFEEISKIYPFGNGLKAFDLGCGAGSFAGELRKRDYKVSAADPSLNMIKIAKAHLGEYIKFYVADSKIAPTLHDAPFDLITSVMALQFIPNIAETFDDLDKALHPQGIIAFAVFNPDFIRTNTGEDRMFIQKDRPEQGTDLFMVAGGMYIPVYSRSEYDYDTLLESLGYVRVFCKRPEFTHDFLEKYPQSADTSFSEYLIMGYRKK